MTEYRAHTCACPCGTRTAAAFPEHLAASPSSYRPHLRTLAVYLMVFQHIPVERTAGLIADVTGAQVSTGWVSALLGQAHGLVADSLKLIRALLTLAHVLHVDETTTRIKDQRCRLHVACTGHLTLLGLAPARGPEPSRWASCPVSPALWCTTAWRCTTPTPAVPTSCAGRT